ncbi:MAG: bifunctional oligoribonuclease/PAP phosphatase NrnA [Candidatus Moranbacteria bacterium]|nr:bifunctional oligoribonuclease/PAP phosphatase NrnA [Candidatus Moranbacteria bacterium]MDD3964638.1 bifunctional oligoribonuclease/PAP phosphatase NrnA [Candidatus Moranbacteria bacterium]
MQNFFSEFHTLKYIIEQSERILLFAHSRPDPDTVGANLALAEYIENCGKHVDIACFDAFPDSLRPLLDGVFFHPDQLDLTNYDAVIASDSVDRGFDKIKHLFSEQQVIVLIDHHPDISLSGDVIIIDPEYSSSSEILYLFLSTEEINITKTIAKMLLTGILFDTGGLQHSNVSPHVVEIVSELVKKGAPLEKITQTIFTKKTIGALKLWGRAFEKARFSRESGMLVTAITREDIKECQASVEDIYQVSSILSAVPDTKFALVLSERDDDTIRASIRSGEGAGVDVSAIAHQFGGGGHKLASGFEIQGKLLTTDTGWIIQ